VDIQYLVVQVGCEYHVTMVTVERDGMIFTEPTIKRSMTHDSLRIELIATDEDFESDSAQPAVDSIVAHWAGYFHFSIDDAVIERRRIEGTNALVFRRELDE